MLRLIAGLQYLVILFLVSNVTKTVFFLYLFLSCAYFSTYCQQ